MSRPARQSTAGTIRLVAGREVRERVRARSFLLGTALLVLIVLAFGVVSNFIGGDDTPTIDIGVAPADVTAAAADLEEALGDTAALFGRDAVVTSIDTAAAAREQLERDDLDVVVDIERQEIVFADRVDDEVLAIAQQAWSSIEVRSALADFGLDPAQIDAALTPTALQPVSLDGDDGVDGLAILTGMITAILLYIVLQTFGTYVLTGVVEEKSTAVIEVLLVRANPHQLIAGKVIGIGVVAMIQFAAAVAAGLVSLGISGVEVPGEVWAAVPMSIVWFLGGYALYSTLFALAGSLVSRQEDANAAAMPINTALIGAYVLVFVLGSDPESTTSAVLSVIPPSAPLLMPMRMAAGAATAVEVIAALVLLVVAILLAWRLAGRIFEHVLLNRGSRIAWRDAAAYLRPGR